MKFQPFNKWIVMKPIDEAAKVGSLYLAPSAANQYRRAEVIALPDLKEVSAMGLSVGQTVFYDTVGEVRVGRGKDETILVSYLNVLGAVLPDEVTI